MDAIISALITGGVTLIGSVIVYQYNMRKIQDNTESIKTKCDKLSENQGGLSKEHNGLSKEHSGLSKEHSGLSKEHSELLVSQRSVQTTVDKINDIVQKESVKSDVVMGNLSDTQKEVRNAVSKVGDFSKMFDSVVAENIRLVAEITSMRQEISQLSLKNELLQNTIDKLTLSKTPPTVSDEKQTLSQKLSQAKEKADKHNENNKRNTHSRDDLEL